MRYVIPWVGLGGLLLVAGCTNTRLGFLNRGDNPPPPSNRPVPTVAALVDYLNNNAQHVRTLRCDDMELNAKMGLGVLRNFDLKGRIACAQPRNFRMDASALGNQELDIGSNDQEFWFWLKRATPPYQFYCPYKALADGRPVQLPFPFQPEWVMETLGMVQYDASHKFKLVVEGRKEAERYKLIEHTRGPQGNRVLKVIVFNAVRQRSPYPQVTDYLLIDEDTNKEICSAHILEVQGDEATGIYPRRMQLYYPKEDTTLTMRLGQTAINRQLPPPLFVRRPLNGQPSINLVTGRPDAMTSGLQRAGLR